MSKTKNYCVHCDKYYFENSTGTHYIKDKNCKKMHDKLLEYIDSGISLDLSTENIKSKVDQYFTIDVFLSGYIGLFDILFKYILVENEQQLFVFVNKNKQIIYYRDRATRKIKSDRHFENIINKFMEVIGVKIEEYKKIIGDKDIKLVSFLMLLVNEYNIKQLNGNSVLPENLSLEKIVNNLDIFLEHVKNT